MLPKQGRRKNFMLRSTNVALLFGAALLFIAANASAQVFGSAGDDLVLCCHECDTPYQYSNGAAPKGPAGPGDPLLFKNCNAIDNDPEDINRCHGVVVNCGDTPAVCFPEGPNTPATTGYGSKACICGVNFNVDIILGLF
jgi:hypothetical protein